MERPSSIVKELIENALDAGAQKITIAIEQGGLEKITVVDDGCGMESEELFLTAERHSTSKITDFSDLMSLKSFGFRGEALSSVAAVSELEIRSRTQNQPHGYTLNILFGEKRPILKCASPVGTKVTVKKLFEKVPARKKFLRSPNTEYSHCLKVVKELALGNNLISFLLSHGERTICSWPASTRQTRVVNILKINSPFEVLESTEDLQINAFFETPSSWRERGDLNLFINGRCIRHRGLGFCVRNAFEQSFGPRHLPMGVLYLQIRSDWVDVNVHPQKLEVRLAQESMICNWIRSVLRKSFCSNQKIATDNPLESTPSPEPSVQECPSQYTILTEVTTPTPYRPALPIQQRLPEISDRRYLGQIKTSYLLWEDSEGILLIDQHALHEKIVYENLLQEHQHAKPKVQSFLVPPMIPIPLELLPVLDEHSDVFQKIGFDLECYGHGDIAVKACPSFIKPSSLEVTLVDCLNQLSNNSETLSVGHLNTILATVACHSVVRSGDRLSPLEAEKLLAGISEIETGWTCPHGRPVLYRIPYTHIEKQFERR